MRKKNQIFRPFLKKKVNFLGNRLTDWAEIFYRETTLKYVSNEPYLKVLLQLEQELWFYVDLWILCVLFFSDFDLMVNNKLLSRQLWVASARHAALHPNASLWIYLGHESNILRTRAYVVF